MALFQKGLCSFSFTVRCKDNVSVSLCTLTADFVRKEKTRVTKVKLKDWLSCSVFL